MSHNVGDDRPLLATLCRALIAAVEGRREEAQRELATAQAMLSPLSDAERETVAKTAELLSRRASTIQCDGYTMHPLLGLVKNHEPHPITTPCPGRG